jgi:hypothetical protein
MKKNIGEKCFVGNLDELMMLIQPSKDRESKDFHYLKT